MPRRGSAVRTSGSTAVPGDETSATWESRLRAVDVMCVEVAKGPVEEVIWFSGGLGEMRDNGDIG
jgi:hypothetical protein